MNEITLYDKMSVSTIVANTDNRIGAIESIGAMVAKSGFYGFDNVAAGQVALVTCLELGIGLHEYGRTFDCIKGKPRKKAMAALVEFEKLGGTFNFIQTGDEPCAKEDDRKAVLELKYKNKTITYSYSIADAKMEQLVKADSRYLKRPGNMLRARATSNALGIICPSIYAGELDEVYDVSENEMKLANPHATVSATQPPADTVTTQPQVKIVEAEIVTAKESSPSPAQPPTTLSSASPGCDTAAHAVEKGVAATDSAPIAPIVSQPSAVSLLPDETVFQIENAICAPFQTDNNKKAAMEAAIKWLRAQVPPWITPGKGLETLTTKRAGNIIKNTPAFLRAIGGGAK